MVPWEREALDQLRHGDPTAALDAYRHHERVHLAHSHDELRDRLVDDWWDAAADGRATDAIMIAHRRTDVADLNARARQRLEQAGELTGPALEIAGREFRAGDRAVCLRNDRRLAVVNGMRGTITAVNLDEAAVWFQPDDLPGPLRLPEAYLESGHLDHGYAVTAHKAQGLTCDATFVLADHTIYPRMGLRRPLPRPPRQPPLPQPRTAAPPRGRRAPRHAPSRARARRLPRRQARSSPAGAARHQPLTPGSFAQTGTSSASNPNTRIR